MCVKQTECGIWVSTTDDTVFHHSGLMHKVSFIRSHKIEREWISTVSDGSILTGSVLNAVVSVFGISFGTASAVAGIALAAFLAATRLTK